MRVVSDSVSSGCLILGPAGCPTPPRGGPSLGTPHPNQFSAPGNPRIHHHGSSSRSHSRVPLESDRSAEKMLGAGGSHPSGGPPLRASSQSKESVGPLGEGDGEFAGDGSEEEKTDERPSESGEGDSTSKEPGKSKGMGGRGSAGEGMECELRKAGIRTPAHSSLETRSSDPNPFLLWILESRTSAPLFPKSRSSAPTIRLHRILQDVIDAPVRKQLRRGRNAVNLGLRLDPDGNPQPAPSHLPSANSPLTCALRIAS